MTNQQERNLCIVKEWWINITSGRQEAYTGSIHEYCAKNHIHYTQFGMGIGNIELLDIADVFHQMMFEALDLTIHDSAAWGNCVVLQASHPLRHMGTFRGLEATGKVATQQYVLTCEIHNEKISQFSLVEDTKHFLSQLVEPEQVDQLINTPMLYSSPAYNFEQWCALFRSKGLRVLPKQLQCLSLWLANYSRDQIVEIMGDMRWDSVESYINIMKLMCSVDNPKQLLEFLVANGLLEVVIQCRRLTLREKGLGRGLQKTDDGRQETEKLSPILHAH
jgi:hypothetical protein